MAERKPDDTMNDRNDVTNQPKVLHNNNLSEDGKLKYDFMTSLGNIALAKISIHLWMNQHTQHAIVNLFHRNIEKQKMKDELTQFANNVLSRVSELFLPSAIAYKLRKIVPLIGQSIIQWIYYHDFLFNTDRCSEYSAVDEIRNIAWTARGRIDHARTAKNILRNRDNCLTDDQKYKLACTYCLEEEIAAIAPDVVSLHYLESVEFVVHPMVYFWTAHVTGDDIRSYILSSHNFLDFELISIHLYVMLLLIGFWKKIRFSCVEVPLRYMWNKLSATEKNENLFILFEAIKVGDLRYSLLSGLDYEQQRRLFRDYVNVSIELFAISLDWSWKEYFIPTALYVWDIMKPIQYFYLMKLLTLKLVQERLVVSRTESGYICNEYKYLFKWSWKKGSKQFKDYLKYVHAEWLEELLTVSLSWELDMDIIRVVFNELNTQDKKNIISGSHGENQCAHFIKHSQWDLLGLFINCTLSSEKDDINKLKQKLLNSRGYAIVDHFVQQKAVDKVENFLKWALTEDRQFQQRIVCSKFPKLSEPTNRNDTQIEFVVNIIPLKSGDNIKIKKYFIL